MIGISILGATGSIGLSTLDVIDMHPDRFTVVALTAHRDVEAMAAQCLRYRPQLAVMADPEAARHLADVLGARVPGTEVLGGSEAVAEAARLPAADYVMAAIVGGAGLMPALAAVRAGKRVLLANKEALVMTGHLFMDELSRCDAELLPIDSEHNAILQCLPQTRVSGVAPDGVRRLLLTASGGPLREWPLNNLNEVTPAQACAHPNWSMGRKISVDSATMMNKGLEVIEACWLFGLEASRIRVLVHPQSVVHSMVEYVDGSVLAHLGHPDMRTPIAHALGAPERIASGVAAFDPVAAPPLVFEEPENARFPCLALATQALAEGGSAPAVLNAANEEAVAAFLDGELKFTAIAAVIEHTLSYLDAGEAHSVEAVLELDRQARALARSEIRRRAS